MKIILGHKSYNQEEIIEILQERGNYTCPTLPHYRYNRVKDVCRNLMKRGFLKKSGRTDEGINLVVTDFFKQWQQEKEQGLTGLGPIKWQKSKKPLAIPPKEKNCIHCKEIYQPSQNNQLFCSKLCKASYKRAKNV